MDFIGKESYTTLGLGTNVEVQFFFLCSHPSNSDPKAKKVLHAPLWVNEDHELEIKFGYDSFDLTEFRGFELDDHVDEENGPNGKYDKGKCAEAKIIIEGTRMWDSNVRPKKLVVSVLRMSDVIFNTCKESMIFLEYENPLPC